VFKFREGLGGDDGQPAVEMWTIKRCTRVPAEQEGDDVRVDDYQVCRQNDLVRMQSHLAALLVAWRPHGMPMGMQEAKEVLQVLGIPRLRLRPQHLLERARVMGAPDLREELLPALLPALLRDSHAVPP
jgi:hypothetical protein